MDNVLYKICSKCKRKLPATKDKLSKKHKKYYKIHKEKIKNNAIKNNKNIRNVVMAHYGGKCVVCGEKHLAFLTIDHINNDGAKHRRRTKCGTSTAFYLWLKNHNYPKNIQLLCWNCNCGIEHNNGKCPHLK